MAVALNLRRADARDGQQLTRTARIALGDRFQGGVGEDGVCRRPAATGALAAPGAQLLEHRPVRGRHAGGTPAHQRWTMAGRRRSAEEREGDEYSGRDATTG